MRAGLLQLTVGDTPEGNVPLLRDALRRAVDGGAGFVLTPEATNCLSSSRSHQQQVLTTESADPVLALLREEAARAGIWVLAGSVILKVAGQERFTNRSILIDPQGEITARYDKIHLFDVQVTPQDTFRESAAIHPGDRAVLAPTPFAMLGLSVCYDVRFPHLYRTLAQAGAQVLCVPAAFNPVTGAAHWEVLLRARAIETGCYVLAPAQTGTHPATVGSPRRSYGRSLAIAPWGEVLADAGNAPGVIYADLDNAEVERARARVPSLSHDRPFAPPLP
jgi:predicted amidohydrolase